MARWQSLTTALETVLEIFLSSQMVIFTSLSKSGKCPEFFPFLRSFMPCAWIFSAKQTNWCLHLNKTVRKYIFMFIETNLSFQSGKLDLCLLFGESFFQVLRINQNADWTWGLFKVKIWVWIWPAVLRVLTWPDGQAVLNIKICLPVII